MGLLNSNSYILMFLHSYIPLSRSFFSVISVANKSVVIRAIRGFIVALLCRFGTCLVRVWYRFVSISIGIFPYVFLPQTSFLNQKQGKVSFSDFLNFTNIQIPGVQAAEKPCFPNFPLAQCRPAGTFPAQQRVHPSASKSEGRRQRFQVRYTQPQSREGILSPNKGILRLTGKGRP